MIAAGDTVLSVRDLSIGFESDSGLTPVVEEVSFDVALGKTLALVGESGCGKSLTALALLNLLPPFGKIIEGSIRLGGRELIGLDEKAMQSIRGNRISMIFQEPMSALNPVFPIGMQVGESLRLHRGFNKKEAAKHAVEMLTSVGIPDAEARAKSYPHELSGGMRQRVLIAMALACEPDVLIADEPTTALDVTIQAQILDLMHDLQEKLHAAILFISHDLGVVSRMADDIAVMYSGRIVEYGPAREILSAPRHPYTRALLETTPRMEANVHHLPSIPGRVPSPSERPGGCHFNPRCTIATPACSEKRPPLIEIADAHRVACLEVSAGE